MARYRTASITMAAANSATTRFDEGRGNTNDNPYSDFFGPLPPHLVPSRADSAYPHESWALPFAYQGRNKFLESVLGMFAAVFAHPLCKCALTTRPSSSTQTSLS